MAKGKVRITCGIDGCTSAWEVTPTQMKKTLAEHRKRAHPDWVQPPPAPMTPYRLDYSGRARQF
jgi:hypothetical protein